MYKTAIAHVEGKLSYDDALQQLRQSYPEYKIRAVKQASFGWMAFIQKEAYQDNFPVEDIPAETEEDMSLSPGADASDVFGDVDESPVDEYMEEEQEQEGLLDKLEAAISEVEKLVAEYKESESEEDEVRPFGDEESEEDEGIEKEFPLEIEREKEAGVTFISAAQEVEDLLKEDKNFKGYRVASFKEEDNRFVATLTKN